MKGSNLKKLIKNLCKDHKKELLWNEIVTSIFLLAILRSPNQHEVNGVDWRLLCLLGGFLQIW